MQLAQVEAQPVVVTVPVDVQREPCDEVATVGLTVQPARQRPPSSAQVRALAELLGDSHRPLILVGRGAASGEARSALLALGDRTGALLATTAAAAALFQGSPHNLGIAGGFSSPTARRLIRTADLVIAFGASLNQWTMGHGRLIDDTTCIVQIDRSPRALGRQYRVTLAINADAELAASALNGELIDRRATPAPFRAEVSAEMMASGWNASSFSDRSERGLIG